MNSIFNRMNSIFNLDNKNLISEIVSKLCIMEEVLGLIKGLECGQSYVHADLLREGPLKIDFHTRLWNCQQN